MGRFVGRPHLYINRIHASPALSARYWVFRGYKVTQNWLKPEILSE